jgi:MFS family permease
MKLRTKLEKYDERERLEKYNKRERGKRDPDNCFSWFPRWGKYLTVVCGVGFIIGAIIGSIICFLGEDVPAIIFLPFGVFWILLMVAIFYPSFCRFRMVRIGRKVAKKLATEWLRAQPFCSSRDRLYEKTFVDILKNQGHTNFITGIPEGWSVWIGFHLGYGFSYLWDGSIPDKPPIYKIVFDRDFNIIAVTQYQESPYTEDVQND